jgi:hypothetical protein
MVGCKPHDFQFHETNGHLTMTKLQSEKPKIGLAKQAYRGAPKGVSHVWPDDVDWSAKPHWSYKNKKLRRAELIATI